jgi:hypothetical protein
LEILCFFPKNTAFTLFLNQTFFDIIESMIQAGLPKLQISWARALRNPFEIVAELPLKRTKKTFIISAAFLSLTRKGQGTYRSLVNVRGMNGGRVIRKA